MQPPLAESKYFQDIRVYGHISICQNLREGSSYCLQDQKNYRLILKREEIEVPNSLHEPFLESFHKSAQ